MDSDYDDDFEMESDDEFDASVTKTPSFETMKADQIVKLMNQYIEEVESIVEVSCFLSRSNSRASATRTSRFVLLL